ncbi:uncharacterized protein LOC105429622 [Pogonomyrmex barbatus]|uniref:Uncharacterized protein LOC105429622 n=1 Tax=Pogonomyrmex barbatus TaxID=144034 RepID=A0A6I9WIC2_9HYME|nr:uncharacterized protein LOC105429622 [Pogonomyrmex barbatus]
MDSTRLERFREPKIYRRIEVPKIDVTRFDQLPPCLKEDNFDLFGVLKKSLPNTIAHVNADHMKTTYQADYSDPAAVRMTQRDVALKVIDTKSQQQQCRMPIKITIEADCPSHCRFPYPIYNANLKHNHKYKSKREKKCEDVERRQMSFPSWKSEYQDSISKIGQAIIKAKLHYTKKKALPVQYQRCTTSN